VQAALADCTENVELAVRITDEAESRRLNHRYCGKNRATNVLSFPCEVPQGIPAEAIGKPIGDLMICAPVVRREALEQHKSLAAHLAHMVVHGVLHLRGFDHQDEAAAQAMEARERDVLARLGFSDPYAVFSRDNPGNQPNHREGQQ